MPKGLISGMLNKGIEMRGFWSGFKLNFYKKNIIVHIKGRELFIRLEKLFNTRQYKNFLFLFLDICFKMRILKTEAGFAVYICSLYL